MKSNSVITHEVVAGTLTGTALIHFHVKGADSIALDMTKLNADVVKRAAIHGMIQRISDAAAISRDPETGKSATPQEKYDAMAQLIAHYESGTSEWSRTRSGDGAPKGVLFRALCIVYPKRQPEEIREWLKGKSKAEKATMRQSKKVRDAIATFTDGAAGDAMLEELDSE